MTDTTITYRAAHSRITRARGVASGFDCIKCGRPAQEWAYQGGAEVELRDARGRPYTTDISRYEPMCASCHRSMDGGPRVPCGTWGGYRRHGLAGEKPCQACRDFRRKKDLERSVARRLAAREALGENQHTRDEGAA